MLLVWLMLHTPNVVQDTSIGHALTKCGHEYGFVIESHVSGDRNADRGRASTRAISFAATAQFRPGLQFKYRQSTSTIR